MKCCKRIYPGARCRFFFMYLVFVLLFRQSSAYSPPASNQANPHSNEPLWRQLAFQETHSNLVTGYILQRVTRYLEARKGHVPATRVLVVNQAGRKHTLWGKGSFSDAAPSRATCIL
jgi:hypothetical protein